MLPSAASVAARGALARHRLRPRCAADDESSYRKARWVHSTVVTALLDTLIPLAAATLAGAIAACKPPRARVTSPVQHFAAGVVFAAAAIELLPELLQHSPVPTLVGFALGIAAMFTLRWVTDRVERAGQGSAGLIAATGADFLVDGLVLGAGFAAGELTGALLTVAIAMEYLFVGTAVAAALDERATRWRKMSVPSGLAVLTTL